MAVSGAAQSTQLPNNIDATQQQFIVDGIKLTFNGNYATHGDPLSLAGLVPGNSVPNKVEIYERPPAGTSPTGYRFDYCPGTTVNNGKVAVLTGSAAQSPATELSAGAYPAALTGINYIYARVWQTRGI